MRYNNSLRLAALLVGSSCFMSAEGTEQVSHAPETVAPNEAVTELVEKYGKKDKVVCLVNDNVDEFQNFLGTLVDGEGNPTYTSFIDTLDDKLFNGFAIAKTENGQQRLIGIASIDAALSDPTVRQALYKVYINRVMANAMDDDTNPASFLSVAGAFKQKFDLDAYKFVQKGLTKMLRDQGLAGVTNKSLQMAFASAAFATTQFPRVKETDWNTIIGIGKNIANNHGHDVSIFDHWLATRAVASGDTSELELGFEALEKGVEAIAVEKTDEAEKPAA